MCVYAMGDIHGNYDAMMELLKLVDPEKDQLVFLGDYIDWGPDSIKVLKKVRELSRSPNVDCLVGNHELMMLEPMLDRGIVRYSKHYDEIKIKYRNWLFRNEGNKTFSDFCDLEKGKQKELLGWMDSLPYTLAKDVCGETIIFAHATPYQPFNRENKNFESYRERAVWERCTEFNSGKEIKDRIKWIDADFIVVGHTISSTIENNHLSVEGDENCALIDCGGKLLGKDFEESKIARLCLFRVDDRKDCYSLGSGG